MISSDTKKKKKLFYIRKTTTYSVSKGPDFSLTVKKEATDITYEMIQS